MIYHERTLADLSVTVGTVNLQNPLIAASGCFGFGREAAKFLDLSELGGIAAKAVTREARCGNEPPRVAETASGMLNAVGLQNPGIDRYLQEELPFMEENGVFIIQNIAGNTVEDYVELARRLQPTSVPVLEMNLSCPNVKHGLSFGADPALVLEVTRAVRRVWDRPLWVKLTPNITSIIEAADAAKSGGADAVSLINTVLGMAIDINSRRPVIRNNTGGLSGPAIKPIALRMVSEIYRNVEIPIVGMGGISSAADVVEFLMAGASAVQIGTANLIHPTAMKDILSNLRKWLAENEIATVRELSGSLMLW